MAYNLYSELSLAPLRLAEGSDARILSTPRPFNRKKVDAYHAAGLDANHATISMGLGGHSLRQII
jgi:hypothetical protein